MKTNLEMERIKERQNRSWDGMFYSIRRLDLLIVSISGAGIYICLETIKYLRDDTLGADLIIKLSGGIFLFAIITNFISQIANHRANYNDYLMCDYKLDNQEKPNDENDNNIMKHENKSKSFSKITGIFNYISTGLMFIGLLLLMVYFLFIF